jgi:hypothetical protein
LPVEVATTCFGGGSSEAISASVPRPLKERIGLSVSIFRRNAQPSAASSWPSRTSGESRKAGSMSPRARITSASDIGVILLA